MENEESGRKQALAMMKRTLQHGAIRRAMEKRKMAESPTESTDELSHEDDLEAGEQMADEEMHTEEATGGDPERAAEEEGLEAEPTERRTVLEVFTPRTEQRQEMPTKRRGR